jgi:hypothetical protein
MVLDVAAQNRRRDFESGGGAVGQVAHDHAVDGPLIFVDNDNVSEACGGRVLDNLFDGVALAIVEDRAWKDCLHVGTGLVMICVPDSTRQIILQPHMAEKDLKVAAGLSVRWHTTIPLTVF